MIAVSQNRVVPGENIDVVRGFHNALMNWNGLRPYVFALPTFTKKHPHAVIRFREAPQTFATGGGQPAVHLITKFDESKLYDIFSCLRCADALKSVIAAKIERALIAKLVNFEDGYGWSGVIEAFIDIQIGALKVQQIDFNAAIPVPQSCSFEFQFNLWLGLYGEGYLFSETT